MENSSIDVDEHLETIIQFYYFKIRFITSEEND